MGVYIPNVEMPQSCFQCPLRLKINPEELWCCALQTVFEETFSGTIDGRYSKCPLVEVKAPHGRLVDADKARCTYMRSRAGYNIPIIEAETVIEAEGEADG